MTKGTVLDCRKEKAGAPITARSSTNVDLRASVQQSQKSSSGTGAKSLEY